MQRLAEALACEPDDLGSAVARLLEREACDRLLVFVDQLEELFTQADADERQRFVRALGVLRADRRCHQIVALRADFYGALMSSALWPDIDGRLTELKVAPLRREALREAIVAPARQAGVHLERELVDRLIDDAAAEPGALPLLQEALVLLWGRRSHRLLHLASYEALGSDGRSGLAVALARRADAVLHDLSLPQQRLAQRIFLRLVSFGEDRPDTRRQQPRAALAAAGDEAADIDAVLDRLIAERMLTSDATAAGEPLVDLAHEALIAEWPELQRWLLSRRDDEQRRRLLELHAAEWAKRGRGNVGLFDAVELGEAERWIAGDTAREVGYSDDLRQFLAVSRAAIEEAKCRESEQLWLRKRLARFVIGALTLFSITASVLGLIAWREQNATRLQLGLNEQERARSLLVESHDASNAIPHLLQAMKLGVDNAALRTLLAEARHGMWRVAVRHNGSATIAVFSPDGSRVVTASSDGTARVWDAATGAALAGPFKHSNGVASSGFSPDGARIVTASSDGTARIWDAATGVPLAGPFEHNNGVTSAAFSPDGARIVTAISDSTARVWDAATGAPLAGPFKHSSGVTSAAFSPNGSRVVTASSDGTARVWDAATSNALADPLKHGKAVTSAAFSPDGSRIITASFDGTARVWDATTGAAITAPLKHDKSVTSAAFSPDGSRAVTASDDGTARIWDTATDAIADPLNHDRRVTSAAFSPDGSRIVTASFDGTARVWDATTGVAITAPLKHDKAVISAAFSPDGSRVVTASFNGTVRVWNTATVATTAVPPNHDRRFTSAAFSSAGSRMVIISSDSNVRVWDTGAIADPLNHHRRVTSAAFSPDGSRIVTASPDGTAHVWDATTGTTIATLSQHNGAVNSAAFSPDGSRVVTASEDGTARVWNAATGTTIAAPLKHNGAVTSAAFSPDGSRVVTASSDGIARVWDAATGTTIAASLDHDGAVTSAAFSPDGSRVVTASSDGIARVWDAATGTTIAASLKHDGAVTSAAFSPDGSRVVTASSDGTARIWDAATGAAIAGSLDHDGAVTSAAFSPDGSRVVTASWDNTARIWAVLETGALAVWVEQAGRCVVPKADAIGSSALCLLQNHKTTPVEMLAQVRSMMLAGDAATFARVTLLSRADYQWAIELLDRSHDVIARADKADAENLRRVISIRLAVLDAVEGHLRDARTHVGTDAPAADADLLDQLGEFAHNEPRNDTIAFSFLLHAHDPARKQVDTITDLAEMYFASGRYHDFARTASQVDRLSTTPDERVAMATLAWAAARLTHTPDDAQRTRLMEAFRQIANGTVVRWTWTGTKHALRYGHVRYEVAKPVLDVLELLEQPVTDGTREDLARLLQAHGEERR